MFARYATFTTAVVAAVGFATPAQAGTYTAPTVTTFTTADDTKDILLTTGSETFSTDLTTYSSFLDDVHTLAGYSGGAGDGTGDVSHWVGDAGLDLDPSGGDVPYDPYVMLGQNTNGMAGFVVATQ